MARFTALPVELVEGIVGELCLFCSPPRHDTQCSRNPFCRCLSDDHPGRRDGLAALASLCLTSRQLNSMATRHLYHRPRCDDKWWLLAATLLAHPDLADFVAELNVNSPGPVHHQGCAPEVVAYFKDQFQTFADAMGQAGNEFDSGPLDDGDSFSGSHNVPVDILVTLCPNLQRLDVPVSYFEIFRFCRPRSLLRLRHVALSHEDSELGFYFDECARLFLAAPNITDMSFWAVNGCRLGAELGCLSNVTSLDFQNSSFGDDALVSILSTCPNVETLRYEMGGHMVGDDQFTLAEVREAVVAHAPKLKYLRLHRGEDDDVWGHWDGNDVEELERVLAERGVCLDVQRRE